MHIDDFEFSVISPKWRIKSIPQCYDTYDHSDFTCIWKKKIDCSTQLTILCQFTHSPKHSAPDISSSVKVSSLS